MNKKLLTFSLVVLSIALVSAVAYYQIVNVNVQVTQPISVSGNLNQNIPCNAGEVCLGEAITISNSGDEDRTITISDDSISEIGVDYVGKLDLSQKDTSTWELIGEPTELIYSLVSEDFEYEVELPEGYVLIYYKDAVVGLEGRLENPQPIIEIVSDIGNLPQSDDANLDADYSEAPDNYEHQIGGKIWAVPEEAIIEGNVLDWSRMNEFLYETDLIYYFANGDNEIVVPAGSFITFYPEVSPNNYLPEDDYPIEITIL